MHTHRAVKIEYVWYAYVVKLWGKQRERDEQIVVGRVRRRAVTRSAPPHDGRTARGRRRRRPYNNDAPSATAAPARRSVPAFISRSQHQIADPLRRRV